MENQPGARKYLAIILAATGVVFFSSKAIFVKKVYDYDIDTLSVLFLRMTFALPVYFVVAVVSTIKSRSRKVAFTDYLWLIVLGFLGYYLASFLDFKGLNYVSASMERLILFVYPTMVLFISWIFMKKAVTQQQRLAVAITYIGVFIAFSNNIRTESQTNFFIGAAFIFVSAISYAFFLVISGNIIPRMGTWRFTSYAMITSCIAVMLHCIAVGNITFNHFPSDVYFICLGMAVFATIIPSFLIAEALKILGASNVAIIGSLGPIATIVMASVFLGEKINAFQFIGTLIVISGILQLNMQRKAA